MLKYISGPSKLPYSTTINMPLFTPYRLATFILLLFCTGHTLGGMLMLVGPPLPPSAASVLHTMRRVSFLFNGGTCTWYNFWFGFGLSASISQLLSAAIAWQLDKVPPEKWDVVRSIAWTLVVAHVGGTVLSWTYFFSRAGVLSTAVTGLLALGAWRKGSRAAVAVAVKKKE
jgi:hypothetical protein